MIQKEDMIKTTAFGKQKKEGGGGGGGNLTYNITTGSSNQGTLTARTINANHIVADLVDTSQLVAGRGNITYLVSSDGTVSAIRGNTLDYDVGDIDDLSSNMIETNTLTVHDTAKIKNIFNDYMQSREIVTDFLTVNRAFHAFEMIIDKIRSVAGTQINTACNCIIDHVMEVDANGDPLEEGATLAAYRCFWKETDDSGNYTYQDWKPGDQAICQNCQLVAGVNHNAGNRYYWRLVENVSQDPVFVNFDTGQVDDESTTVPAYKIKFCAPEGPQGQQGPQGESGPIFNYTNSTDPDATPLTYSNWNITSQIPGKWENETLTVDDTLHGIQLVPRIKPLLTNGDDVTSFQEYYISKGKFTFGTEQDTRLNVLIMFDDDSLEYHPAGDKTKSYEINIIAATHARVTAIVITSDEVNIWHSCHWIDLSATDYDGSTAHLIGNYTNNGIPAPKDNIVQLGYRFTYPTGVQTPAQFKDWMTDYPDAFTTWYNANKDEVDRASAQIIAAYKSPDTSVRPPSFAQYQYIHDYSLSSYKESYFDATGAYFKGKLVSTGGTIIPIDDNGFDVDAEVYKIIPNYDIITKDIDDVVVPNTLDVSFLVPNSTILSTNVPTGCKFEYTIDNGSTVTVNAGNSVSIELYDANDTPKDKINSKLLMQLYKQNSSNQWEILDQIEKAVVTIDVASGENGLNAPENQWAYKNAVSITSDDLPTAANSDTYINDWTTYAVPLTAADLAAEKATWQRQRTNTWSLVNNQNNKSYGTWSPATRITGQDGKNGEDAKDIEFIYRTFSAEQDWGAQDMPQNLNPEDWYDSDPESIYQDDDYTGPAVSYAQSNYTTWSDNPRGITPTYKYEYMSQRKWDAENKLWEQFTEPVIWSAWGERGLDGDGYEYIYTTEWSNQYQAPPAPPAAYGPYPEDWPNDGTTDHATDYNGTVWYDDPQGVNSTNTQEYVSTRKKENGTWGPYSTPALWAQYVPRGTDGRHGDDTQWAYKNATSIRDYPDPNPDLPTDDSDDPEVYINNWSTEATTPDFANGEYTWCRTRTIGYDIHNDRQYGNWSPAYRITGDNGKNGEDGDTIEFIYKRFTGPQTFGPQGDDNPANWAAVQTPDYTGPQGHQWTDNPDGISTTYKYEYVASREFTWGPQGPQGEQTKQWGTFSQPGLWSRWGEDGRDGDGYEYIYILNNTSSPFNIDETGTDSQGRTRTDDEYLPESYVTIVSGGSSVSDYQQWSDDPLSISEDNFACWVSTRKKSVDDDPNSATYGQAIWSYFSPPSLWSRWSAKGSNGGEYEMRYNPGSVQGPRSQLIPNGSQSYSKTQMQTAGWQRTEPVPTVLLPHVWMTQAFFNDGEDTSVWSTPVRVTGADGPQGDRGTDGTDFEFIYTRNNTGVAPTAPVYTIDNVAVNTIPDWPTGGEGEDSHGITWTDNPKGVQADMQYEYMCQRRKLDGQQTWEAYSPTSIWSKWGQEGRDGDGVEYIFCLSTSEDDVPLLIQSDQERAVAGLPAINNAYVTFDSGGGIIEWLSDGGDEYIRNNREYLPISYVDDNNSNIPGTNWTDDPTGIDEVNQVEWVSQRTYNGQTKRWGDFSEPSVWAKWGENGTDGAGYERCFIVVPQDFVSTNTSTGAISLTSCTINGTTVNPNPVYDPSYTDFTIDDEIPYITVGSTKQAYYTMSGGVIQWTDNPSSVTSTFKYQFETERRKTINSSGTGVWGSWSTPVLWNSYQTSGPQGPQGSQGLDGENGETWKLVPIDEIFEVRIGAKQTGPMAYENIQGVLYTKLNYAVSHTDGDQTEFIGAQEIQGYTLRVKPMAVQGTDLDDTESGICTYGFSGWQCDGYSNISTGQIVTSFDGSWGTGYLNSGGSVYTLILSTDNLLSSIYPNASNSTKQTDYNGYKVLWDYYFFHKNIAEDTLGQPYPGQPYFKLVYYMPVSVRVELVKNNKVLDHKDVSLIFKPDHLFSVGDAALNSIYQGLSGVQGGEYTATGFSQIHQDWQNISLGVNNIESIWGGQLPQNSQTEQYIYSAPQSSDTAPSAPSNNTTWGNTPSGWYAPSNYSEPTASNPYVFGTYRRRTYDAVNGTYGTPTAWATPTIAQVYGQPRTIVNSSQLSLAADKIVSKVSEYVSYGDAESNLLNGTIFKSADYVTSNGWSEQHYSSASLNDGSSTLNNNPSVNLLSGTGDNVGIHQFIDNDELSSNICFSIYIRNRRDTSGGNRSIGLGVYYGSTYISGGNGYISYKGAETGLRVQTWLSYSEAFRQWIADDYEWHRIYVTFEKPNYTGNLKFIIRTWGDSSFDITMPKVECKSGLTEPTNWIPGLKDSVSYSQMTQTATEIKAEVVTEVNGELTNTGIDISAGKINLNADNTNINGNLNVYNPNEGLAIYDNYSPRIVLNNSSVGTYANYNEETIAPLSVNVDNVTVSGTTYTVKYYNDANGSAISLGTFSNGDQITISNVVLNMQQKATFEKQWTSGTYIIYINGSSVKSGSLTTKNSYIATIPDYTYTVSSTGNVTFDIQVTWTVPSTGRYNTYLRAQTSVAITTIQTIGTDGAIFKTGANKHLMIASDETNIRYDNSMLRINSDGIKTNGTSSTGDGLLTSFGNISSTVPYKSPSNTYTVTNNDCLLFCGGRSNHTIHLPKPNNSNVTEANRIPYGKVYYIANMRQLGDSNTVTIDIVNEYGTSQTGTNIINNGGLVSSITVNANHTCIMVAVDGGYAVLSYR